MTKKLLCHDTSDEISGIERISHSSMMIKIFWVLNEITRTFANEGIALTYGSSDEPILISVIQEQ